MREAIGVSEMALEKTLKEIRIGVTEREVEAELLLNLYAAGAKEMAFSPIVLGGAQAAEPHGHAGGYRMQRGDTLLFDFGAAHQGYNADITRTVFVGEPEDDARAFYETVREANRIGRDSVRPGMTAAAVDDAVQRFLEASPFVAHIVHKTGHGLGLDVHEAPQVMRGDDTRAGDGYGDHHRARPVRPRPSRRPHRRRRRGDGGRRRVAHPLPARTARRRIRPRSSGLRHGQKHPVFRREPPERLGDHRRERHAVALGFPLPRERKLSRQAHGFAGSAGGAARGIGEPAVWRRKASVPAKRAAQGEHEDAGAPARAPSARP